jgi:hypothetical protein
MQFLRLSKLGSRSRFLFTFNAGICLMVGGADGNLGCVKLALLLWKPGCVRQQPYSYPLHWCVIAQSSYLSCQATPAMGFHGHQEKMPVRNMEHDAPCALCTQRFLISPSDVHLLVPGVQVRRTNSIPQRPQMRVVKPRPPAKEFGCLDRSTTSEKKQPTPF